MEQVELTGMVLKSSPVNDYDKRIVILTKERGKVTAFAKGARRPKSTFSAGSRPFSFGRFTLYPGQNAYSMSGMNIENYFEELMQDFEGMCYGCYFLEIADYYGQEGMEATDMLKLIYQSFRALLNKKISNKLIRYIFEIKMLEINGEYPQVFECINCGSKQQLHNISVASGGMICDECLKAVSMPFKINESTLYTLQYVLSSSIEKLYSFTVNNTVMEELRVVMSRCMSEYVDKEFKSLEIINE